jgi:hypothetical protein
MGWIWEWLLPPRQGRLRSGTLALLLELSEPFDSFLAERRGITSDADLARLFDARHPPIQRCDQLLELAGELVQVHRHGFPPKRRTLRRETFQTSPHFSQRQ